MPAPQRAATQAAARLARTAPTAATSASTRRGAAAQAGAADAAGKKPPVDKGKAIIWTIGFAAVTVSGAIYGATLKTQQEWKAEKEKFQTATVDERVSVLEQRRAQLLKQKHDLEIKIADLRARTGGMTGTPETAQEKRDRIKTRTW
ncbi:hypothetical protein B0H66DRAFT_598613 [Apodospora peruviana]|uniref:Uncharacterized protein n=1 Tax=Apodospora peruviana TaxID=516989 RepID=A0AAE0MHF5_9PEZI|nr:hypothetical protein B0H66DRAFT_598613 [Apodospora peruviana]